ncbi:MAG: sigma-E factor negative regulatory protein [Pseudomonadota bacterium]|nr:sigma-E factor negative regulatory protein [Xanthomonadaceae bacterium]MDE2248221.1 sigma-E factor negative regulatory protein [Xanthomonadaceae bacterium]MDE3209830.1 sigma-E factor negative regulatory protein [Pseudomonadota bacterium]
MNQAGMNQNIQETLSAGVDGELSKDELRFLLRRLDHDASLQHTWDRYHVARDGLRRKLPPLAGAGFSERVMLAIERESGPVARGRRNHWLRWSAGGAIAASVAAAALMISQPGGDADRMAATSSSAQAKGSLAGPAPVTAMPTVPAAVPPWLSGNSAGLLSQQASATFGETSFGSNSPLYPQQVSPNQAMRGYRTLDNNDGTYLLLLEPVQQRQRVVGARRPGAVAQ